MTNSPEDTKILITGGAGYLGSVLTPHLLNLGYQVTVLDNFLWSQSSLVECCCHESFEIVRGDCRDQSLVEEVTRDKDIIIPLAALVGAPLCKQDQTGASSVNFAAIEMLKDILRPEQKVIYPTTNSGYGIGEKGKYCTEETPLRPISLYGETKVKAEEVLLQRENTITFRLATVFGMSSRMRLDLLVNDFVYRAVNDRTVVIFEGHFKRNYVHIRDVARAFAHAIDHFEEMKGKPYNVGLNEANFSKLELCEIIKQFVPQFVFMEASIGEDPDKRDYIVSNDRILATGYETIWSLEQGIKELIKGYQIIKNSKYSNV